MTNISLERNTKQKTPNNILKMIKSNCLNYGVFFLGYIFTYILISMLLPFVFGVTGMTSTIITNIIITVLSLFLYFRSRYKLQLPSFKSHNELTLRQILFWCFYMIVMSYLLLLFFQWFRLNVYDESMIQRSEDMQKYSIVFYLFFSCILAPLAEESMIRLYSYNQLKRSSNWIISMIVSSFVFAALHGTFTHIIIATFFGVILTLSYEYTGCCVIPILGHSIYNFMALFTTDAMFFGYNNIAVMIAAILFIIIVIFQTVKLNNKMKSIKYKDMIS